MLLCLSSSLLSPSPLVHSLEDPASGTGERTISQCNVRCGCRLNYTRLLSPWPTFSVTQASKILNQKGSFTGTSRALSWWPTSRGTCGWWGWLLHRWWHQKEQFHHVIYRTRKQISTRCLPVATQSFRSESDNDIHIRVDMIPFFVGIGIGIINIRF